MNYIYNEPYNPIAIPTISPERQFVGQMQPSGNAAPRNNQTITVVIRK